MIISKVLKTSTLLFFLTTFSICLGLDISNFKSGLMCGINKDNLGWVCFEQEKILVTGQSSCVAEGKVSKCTWYGFSFDYKGARVWQKIHCTYKISNPSTLIDLNNKIGSNVTAGEMSFRLKATRKLGVRS